MFEGFRAASSAAALAAILAFTGAASAGAEDNAPNVVAEDQSDQLPPADAPAADAPADPGASGDTAPAAPDSAAAPESEPAPDAAAAPAAEPSGDTGGEQPAAGTADAPPAAEEPSTTTAEPQAPPAEQPPEAAASNVDASQLTIGTAVYGADGAKIGEVNGVKSDGSGKVQEILVTDGVAAGINAKVFAVSGDKITDTKDGVKLSLSSEEAKKLPIIDNGNG